MSICSRKTHSYIPNIPTLMQSIYLFLQLRCIGKKNYVFTRFAMFIIKFYIYWWNLICWNPWIFLGLKHNEETNADRKCEFIKRKNNVKWGFSFYLCQESFCQCLLVYYLLDCERDNSKFYWLILMKLSVRCVFVHPTAGKILVAKGQSLP